MEEYINWLERQIENCLNDKDLQREHWAFVQALKKYREIALRKHEVVGRSEQFKCGKCSSNWGEVRATCFECGHESEDLST